MSDPGPRLPLAGKILVGLLLNLLGIGVVFTAAALVQLRFNPGWLLAGRAGERLQSVAEMLGSDLGLSTPGEETNVVARYEEAYALEFLLFDGAGNGIGHDGTLIPPEVRRELGRVRQGNLPLGPRTADGTGPGANPGPLPGRGPGYRRFGNLPAEERRIDGGPGGLPQHRGSGPRAGPRAVLRAGVPPAYWIVLPLPPRERDRAATVVIRTPSLWSGGLLLDPRPWLLAGLAAMALSFVFWLPFVRAITRDIGRMTRRTAEIAAGRFDARLDLGRKDELGQLASSIDQMAARLASHVAGQKRFLGDAAHELCAPIARLQTAIAILESRSPEEDQARLQDVREDLDEMAALVGELLAFSRATHGRSVRVEPVELRPLVERAWNRESGDAPGLDLRVPSDARVLADGLLVQRALANLFRNALRYAAHSGPVTVEATRSGAHWVVSVADQGPGVPEEALPRLFEPFYRPEPSRARELGGTGLGLAIVKTCVDACNGTVEARNRSPRGFEVRLTLPAATA